MVKWTKYVGKKVFLKTKHDRFFTIDVEEVDDTFLTGIDKFNEPVDIAISEIATIVPVSGGQYGR